MFNNFDKIFQSFKERGMWKRKRIPPVFDRCASGRKLLSNTESNIIAMVSFFSKPQFVSPFYPSENALSGITGEELIRRAHDEFLVHGGRRYAEYLVADTRGFLSGNQRYIFLFPGTIWQDEDEDAFQYIPCLCWDSGKWYPKAFCLKTVLFPKPDVYRLVKPEPPK